MKCQILFARKNKKNMTNLSSAESAPSVVSVKDKHDKVGMWLEWEKPDVLMIFQMFFYLTYFKL